MKFICYLFLPLILFAYSEDPLVFVKGEVLYWQAAERGLDLVVTDAEIVSLGGGNSALQIDSGKVVSLDTSWAVGGRLALTFHRLPDCWDITTCWTHFNADQSKSVTADPGKVLLMLNSGTTGATANQCDHVSGKWDLRTNVLDLILSRYLMVSEHIELFPFFGVKGGWIHQLLHASYHLTLAISGFPQFDNSNLLVQSHFDFLGGGPSMGIRSQWLLGRCIHVYGQLAAALLYGQYERSYRVNPPETFVAYRQDCMTSQFTYQLALGLQWAQLFSKNRCKFGINAGWELNVWMDMNKIFNDVSIPFNLNPYEFVEDLTFQGLNLGLYLDY